MNTIITEKQYSSQSNAPANLIVEKYSAQRQSAPVLVNLLGNPNLIETSNLPIITEKYTVQPLYGLRESCEDTICSDCLAYVQSKQYAKFRECKQQCFIDKKDDISACCNAQCSAKRDDGSTLLNAQGLKECVSSCGTPMIYAEGVPAAPTGRATTVLKSTKQGGCSIM